MYQISNDEDEFEPRITPKPTSKLDCFAVPSVPEVSLIFDKPLGYKTIERTGFQSPPVDRNTSTQKSNTSYSSSANGSYAAWKQHNYVSRPSNNIGNTVPQNIQSSQNYVTQPYLMKDTTTESPKESMRNDHCSIKDISNSTNLEEKKSHRRSDSNSYGHSYHVCENNITPIDKTAQYNNSIEQRDCMSPTSHTVRTYIDADNYAVNKRAHFPLCENQLITNDSKQQNVSFNNSVNEPDIQNSHINPKSLKKSEYQLPHYVGQQYPYFNMNAYPFPQFHPYSVHNTENQETVKNLLQIINSQNEQIKSLQVQVDRLLKMQEENLKERKKCSCSYPMQQHNSQFYTNSNDALNSPNHIAAPKSTKRNICQNEVSKDKRKENYNENENINQNELILAEAQAKKTFMEQKVSIGVMTSFEFTVQNSPFTLDVDDCEKQDGQQKKENLKLCNNVGICDNNEPLRRYKSSFTRMPSAQLENIVEDSESYMSSSQQQSSNLNASTSTKDVERQAYIDIQKETDILRSNSPKLGKNTTTNLNQTRDRIQKDLGRICTEEVRNYDIVKVPAVQRNTVNTEYNVLENKNDKISSPTNADYYKKLKMKKDSDSNGKASNSVNSSDCYKDYQKGRHTSVAKGVNCIEDSLILNGGDLKINERPPPTPEPSIHVDMNEYSSDDDSEKVKRSSKVGWTFYNNVLGQVNQLLQNSCVIDDQQQNQTKINQNERYETENKAVLGTVKHATLEQLKKLGISLNENPESKELNSSNKMAFDLSFYPRLDYQANMTQATSGVNETNTSMHMKALALKYLTDEQLAELAVQKQGSTSLKHLMVSNVQGTNMSFATMRYLERYQLLPGKNGIQTEDINKVAVETPSKIDIKHTNPKNSPKVLQRFPFNQTPKTSCPSKILDISTLKQQPKLL
ncbi:uncharacterized protein LOC100881935 [Megachile rotundata]|uniref:uncharacterized protein LOC100881935 n=1 Tax=Megachile rotundata TaxID=143995 RepID=UPI000614F8C9|nr:PREDICTED: protein kinase 4-like [Megachile rotundata]